MRCRQFLAQWKNRRCRKFRWGNPLHKKYEDVATLRPRSNPLLPIHFMNVGMSELGWRAIIYTKVFHGTWYSFLLCLSTGFFVSVFIFWIPVIIMYSFGDLSVTNVNSVEDTVALAFTTLLNIPSIYVPTSATAVIAVSLETGFRRFILAGVTAILVVKASKVQNNIVLSNTALFHKKHGHWYISLRVGVLYGQRIFGAHFRLAVVGNIPGHDGNVNWVKLKLHDITNDTEIEMAGVPRNLRHRIDETSPLFFLTDLLENNKDVSNCFESLYLFFNGIDELSGRGVGKSRCYRLALGEVIINKNTQLEDVVLHRNVWPDSIRRGSIFRTVKGRRRSRLKNEITMGLEQNPHVQVGIFWPNFHLHKNTLGKPKEGAGVMEKEATPQFLEKETVYTQHSLEGNNTMDV